MTSFFENVLANTGRTFQSGLDVKQQQLTIAEHEEGLRLKKQQEQMNTMLMQTQQKEQQYRQQLGADVSSGLRELGAQSSDIASVIKVADKAALNAAARGDFEGMALAEKLSSQKQVELKQQQAAQMTQTQQAKETLAATATEFKYNPTPESAQAVVKSALAAGVPIAQIPLTSDPKFGAWAASQTTAGMDSKSRAQLAEKAKEHEQALEEKKREFQERQADRREAQRDRAMFQQGMLEVAKERADAAKERAAKAGTDSGMGKAERSIVSGIVGSAGEAVRGLDLIAKMSATASAGVFAGVHTGKDVISSLERVGTNRVTSEESQMYQTATAGLGLEIGRMLTLGGGRGITQSQINELQNVIQVYPGDTGYTSMFKLANAASLVRNRLETLPESPDPKVRAQQEKLMKKLEIYPEPEEILASARKKGIDTKTMLKTYADMGAAMSAAAAAKTPAAAASGGTSIGDGWSVKEH